MELNKPFNSRPQETATLNGLPAHPPAIQADNDIIILNIIM